MVYYKILDALGNAVDAEAIANPVYVCWQEKNKMLLRCKERDAQGLVSDKNSDIIYHLDGKHLNGVESDLSAVPISEAEYDEYVATCDQEPDPEDETPEKPDDQPELEILTRAELTERVLSQAEEIQQLRETNAMLTDCILEMSEVVYGE